jgi:hypothetical protein
MNRKTPSQKNSAPRDRPICLFPAAARGLYVLSSKLEQIIEKASASLDEAHTGRPMLISRTARDGRDSWLSYLSARARIRGWGQPSQPMFSPLGGFFVHRRFRVSEWAVFGEFYFAAFSTREAAATYGISPSARLCPASHSLRYNPADTVSFL